MASNSMKAVQSFGDAVLLLNLLFNLERLLHIKKTLVDPKLELKRESVL